MLLNEDPQSISKNIKEPPDMEQQSRFDNDEEERIEIQNEIEAAPPKTGSWVNAAMIIISYQVGVGVMSLPLSFVNLGYVLGICSLLCWLALCLFIGHCLIVVKETWPTALSYGDVAFHAFRSSKTARTFITLIVDLNLFLMIGEYILVVTQALELLFYDFQICTLIWTAIAVGLQIPLYQFRLLNPARWLLFLNLILIVSALFISLISITIYGADISDSSSTSTTTTSQMIVSTSVLAPDSLNIFNFFTSQAYLSFSLGFTIIAIEVMSEMRDFTEFRKSVVGVISFTGTFYLMTSIWGYALLGSAASGLLVSMIIKSGQSRAAAACLLLHVLTSSLVPGTVLSRSIHRRISPKTLGDYHFKGRIIYFLISLIVVVLAALVSVGIPFFDYFTTFIGALFLPYLSYALPFLFYRSAMSHKNVSVHWIKKICIMVVSLFLLFLTVLGVIGTILSIVRAKNKTPTIQYCS